MFYNDIDKIIPNSGITMIIESSEYIVSMFIFSVLLILIFNIYRKKQIADIDMALGKIKMQAVSIDKYLIADYSLTTDKALKEVEKLKGSFLAIINYFISNITYEDTK